MLPADEHKMKQVITNLLSNAVKFSHEGGRIWIAATNDGGNAVLSVKDNGIGISEKDRELIFERLYRADQSRSRKTGGVGICLTIVNAIVKAHGGSIEVESEEGKGSTFIVFLPQNSERSDGDEIDSHQRYHKGRKNEDRDAVLGSMRRTVRSLRCV